MMKIYLVVNCLNYGDGVGNSIMAQQKMFRDMGYMCDIYSSVSDERMKNKRKNLTELKCTSKDLLIHHYAGYFDHIDMIERQNCRKVFIYHNITPPEFVAGDTKLDCQMGLDQVATLGGLYDAVVGVSQFNVDCLKKLGMIEDGEVLPIPVEFSGPRIERRGHAVIRGARFLFVGRYAPNKKLEDIISAFAYYHDYIDWTAKLRLVGNPNVMQDYTDGLRQLIDCLDCRDSIELTGKVNDEQLQKLYMDSDIFLCMSEHEGFCIPLIEAMWHQLPVFAFDAGAVRETMGDAGVVFTDKTPVAVAHLIAAVMKDTNLLKTIIQRQNRRVSDFSTEKVKERLEELLPHWLGEESSAVANKNKEKSTKKLKIQIQGPFETSYSLAQVNRFLIEAMYKTGLADVSIHCTEGPGDYVPEEKNLKDKPLARYLWQREKTFGTPDVALRNMYPLVTTGLTAQLNFQSFGWEEDHVPQKYIGWFNRDLDGIGTTSDFVTQALKDSGLTIPVKTIGNGVRLPENYEKIKPYPLKTRKTIRFLHISSAFPRKGIDVLLETYFDTFTAEDDVCLVLKTFPNIHNMTADQLKKLQKKYPDGPEVEHIDMDLAEEQLYALYKAASCYVYCARGEDFGLTVAEAMLARLPVIVCNNTGLADFCREDTCLTVRYTVTKTNSHLSENSNWAEPDREQLKQRMHDFVFCISDCGTEAKVENAYQLISKQFTWEAVAKRWFDFIHEVQEQKAHPKVDMVTTWNNKCGIAEFARCFVEASNQLVDYHIYPDTGHELVRRDEEFVQKRVWHQGEENDDIGDLVHALKVSRSKIVHIQYNMGFFSLKALAQLCWELKNRKHVIVLFHSTGYVQEKLALQDREYVIRGLNSAYRIVVHQRIDIDELLSIGIDRSIVTMIPYGQMTYIFRSVEHARHILGISSNHVIGSYGFLLPHKGIEKTIRAVAILKEKYPDIIYIASCSLYDSDLSRDYYQKCKETIRQFHLEKNVYLFTGFLDPKESITLLQACNVLVMPYDKTKKSASDAIRFCVAVKRPLITTQQDVFKEFEECSYQIDQNDPEAITAAVERMFDPAFAQSYIKKIQQHIEATSWHTVAKKYYELYQE